MKVIKFENVQDFYSDIDVFELLEEDGIQRSDIPELIRKISSVWEEWIVDVDILNTIVKILLDCEPESDNLKGLDVESLKKLINISEDSYE